MIPKTLAAAAGAILALLVLVPSAIGQAPDGASVGALRIDGAWARATAPTARTGAAYLAISNAGNEADRLVGAAAPVGARAELHTHVTEGNVVRMRQVQAIDIPAGGRVVFAPGGLHVMLMDLRGPLSEGTRFALTLRFARAGEVTVEVPVSRNPPVSAPASGHRH